MKKGLKLIAAAIAAVTAMSCTSVTALAYTTKMVDGVMYRYTDDGVQKGKYTGWITAKSGAKYYYKDGVKVKNKWLKADGKRTYYLDKKGKAAVGEKTISGCTYYFGADAKLIYGIQVKGSDKTNSGMTLALNGVAYGAGSTAQVWSYKGYWLERKNAAGEWVRVPPNSGGITDDDCLDDETNISAERTDDNSFFIDGSLVRRTEKIDWSRAYESMQGGEYRLCKPYFVQLTPDSAVQTKLAYVKFNLKVFSGAEEAWGITMTAENITTDMLTLHIVQPYDASRKGYINYGGGYILEMKDAAGNWVDVDKAAKDKAWKDYAFSDLYGSFGDDDDPNGACYGDASDSIEYYTGALTFGHYRVKRLFSGNCGGVKGSLYATAEFDITAFTPNSYGILMKASNDASESGMTLNVTKTAVPYHNMVDDVWTGEDYEIEKLTADGDWEALEPASDEEFYWDDVGIIIPEGETKKFSLNWTKLYGKLKQGTYRIVKTFYVQVNPQFPHTNQKLAYCTFTIGNSGVNVGKFEVAAKVTQATNSYLALELTRTGEYTGGVWWDGSYEIHRKNSKGKWTLYKNKSALYLQSDEDEGISNNATVKTGITLSSVYPSLKAGTYRVKLKFHDDVGNIKYSYAGFVIR